jgi:hypothetical protein
MTLRSIAVPFAAALFGGAVAFGTAARLHRASRAEGTASAEVADPTGALAAKRGALAILDARERDAGSGVSLESGPENEAAFQTAMGIIEGAAAKHEWGEEERVAFRRAIYSTHGARRGEALHALAAGINGQRFKVRVRGFPF